MDAPIPGDHRDLATINAVAEAATHTSDVVSAAIFVVDLGSGGLTLAAAAGIEGEALDRLVSAVHDPTHPIARTLADQKSTFNVTPMAPGGPALRSHVPLVVERGGWLRTVGVLAVAHDSIVDESEQQTLTDLAAQAASLTAGDGG